MTPPLADASPSSSASVDGGLSSQVMLGSGVVGVPMDRVGLPLPSAPMVYGTVESALVPNTSADQVPAPTKSASAADFALMDSLSPFALTVTFVVPAVFANLTMPGSVVVDAKSPTGVSVTPEILPTGSRVTSTVRVVPSSGSVVIMPPVWAIGSLVLAAAAAGNVSSPSATTAARPRARRDPSRFIRPLLCSRAIPAVVRRGETSSDPVTTLRELAPQRFQRSYVWRCPRAQVNGTRGPPPMVPAPTLVGRHARLPSRGWVGAAARTACDLAFGLGRFGMTLSGRTSGGPRSSCAGHRKVAGPSPADRTRQTSFMDEGRSIGLVVINDRAEAAHLVEAEDDETTTRLVGESAQRLGKRLRQPTACRLHLNGGPVATRRSQLGDEGGKVLGHSSECNGSRCYVQPQTVTSTVAPSVCRKTCCVVNSRSSWPNPTGSAVSGLGLSNSPTGPRAPPNRVVSRSSQGDERCGRPTEVPRVARRLDSRSS